jgi:hypothetical protein
MISTAGRIANATSDSSLAAAIQLEGQWKSSQFALDGRTKDFARNDQILARQMENKAMVDQYNTGVVGQNRGLLSRAILQITGNNADLVKANAGV